MHVKTLTGLELPVTRLSLFLNSGESSASFSWSGNDAVFIEPFIRGVSGMDISYAAMVSNFGGTWSYPGLFLGFSPFKTVLISF